MKNINKILKKSIKTILKSLKTKLKKIFKKILTKINKKLTLKLHFISGIHWTKILRIRIFFTAQFKASQGS